MRRKPKTITKRYRAEFAILPGDIRDDGVHIQYTTQFTESLASIRAYDRYKFEKENPGYRITRVNFHWNVVDNKVCMYTKITGERHDTR